MSRPPGSQWTDEVRAERNRENMRRLNSARNRAFRDLAKAHRTEFRQIMAKHRDAINAERGPLPGDD